MNTLVNNSEIIKHVSAVIISAVVTFIAPALPSLGLITAMIAADFVSARMLARRIRRRLRGAGQPVPPSGGIVVCGAVSVSVGNDGIFIRGSFFRPYDCLEYYLYYLSGFMDISQNFYKL